MAHAQNTKTQSAHANAKEIDALRAADKALPELQRDTPLLARIVGEVEYRQGDGPKQLIPHGPVEVQTTHDDATLSWEDGETRSSAAIPMSDFKRYRSSGAIELKH